MTQDEFSEMLMCVEDEQLKKFYQLGVLTGMRRGELLYLTWENVSFEQKTISIESSEQYRVKQGKGRMLPMTPEIETILKSLRENDPYIFTDKNGQPYKEDFVTKRFKKAVRAAELRGDFHLHCLRHTCATWLGCAGVEALTIKEILGHTYLKTTEAYTRIPGSQQRKAMERLTLPPM
ncbi:MAG: tyrosine-type recombinase/integrase [Bacteroidota bacterium]